MSKFLAIFLVASVCCLASAESLGSQTNLTDLEKLMNFREKLEEIHDFLGNLKRNLSTSFTSVNVLLHNKDLFRDEDYLLLSLAKENFQKIIDDLQPTYDTLEELLTGIEFQPQFG